MTTQMYGSPSASPNTFNLELQLLKHAESVIVIGKFGVQKMQPLNKTDTIYFPRANPYNVAANGAPQIDSNDFIIAEGVTPRSHTMDYTYVPATLQQFGYLMKLTDKTMKMHEMDVSEDMKQQVGEVLGEVAEKAAYGVIRGGTSVIRANGSTRAAINTTITADHLRLAARTMKSARGKTVSKSLAAGPNFATYPVQRSFLCFHHSDVTADIQALSGFNFKVNYGTATTPIHEDEHGAWQNFRFIESPLFDPWLAQGATVAGTTMLAANATNIDVYPIVVMAEDAWGHISLKGEKNTYTGIRPSFVSPNEISAANPLGLFGYVGASFWYTPIRLNENWMTRIEVAVNALA